MTQREQDLEAIAEASSRAGLGHPTIYPPADREMSWEVTYGKGYLQLSVVGYAEGKRTSFEHLLQQIAAAGVARKMTKAKILGVDRIGVQR